MKHIPSKWTTTESHRAKTEKGEMKTVYEIITKSKENVITRVCVVWNKANSERIVQMNNSFDELLEACKEIIQADGAFGYKNGDDYIDGLENTIKRIIIIAKRAIANAEGGDK